MNQNNTVLKAYACINRDNKTRKKSSSGGVYSLIAEEIIKRGGCVFAAVYDDSLNVIHKEIIKKTELEATFGAKYVFSKIGNCFSRINQRLTQGKWVLFVGTPCQCAALKNYLGNKNEKLICVDFVCHGTPSSKYWKQYLDCFEKKYHIKISGINMRDKTSGWSGYSYSWRFLTENKKELFQKQNKNLYMRGFIADIFLREPCYSCKYKGINRYSDLTLGDCWGIDNSFPEMDDNLGTSLVIINTDLGNKLFHIIKKRMVFKKISEKDFLPYNPSYYESSKKPTFYNDFHSRLNNGEDFNDLIVEYLQLKERKPLNKHLFAMVVLLNKVKKYITKHKNGFFC